MGKTSDVTGLLVAWSNGEETAGGALMDAVYGELRRLARFDANVPTIPCPPPRSCTRPT